MKYIIYHPGDADQVYAQVEEEEIAKRLVHWFEDQDMPACYGPIGTAFSVGDRVVWANGGQANVIISEQDQSTSEEWITVKFRDTGLLRERPASEFRLWNPEIHGPWWERKV